MASNRKQPQQKRTGNTGNVRRTEINPLKLPPDTSGRQEAWTDDDAIIENDDLPFDPPRQPTSAIRYQQPTGAIRRNREEEDDIDGLSQRLPISPRRTSQAYDAHPGPTRARAGRGIGIPTDFPPASSVPKKKSMHWLLYVGVGMIAALALWVTFSSLLAWGIAKYNDIAYGYPRYFQTDAVVGHNDSATHPSHFVAMNLHGQVIVVELPGGDPSHSYDYVGPNMIASGDDLIPITLTFDDTHHNGKPEMVIHIQDHEVIFCNDGTKFTTCSTP